MSQMNWHFGEIKVEHRLKGRDLWFWGLGFVTVKYRLEKDYELGTLSVLDHWAWAAQIH